MSTKVKEDIKNWTAKRKAALVMKIIQGKTTVAEASRSFDLQPSEVEEWVNEAYVNRRLRTAQFRSKVRPHKYGMFSFLSG